jgi:hypothetical protein
VPGLHRRPETQPPPRRDGLGLEPRCVGCQLVHETQKPLQLRPENVPGVSSGGDYDSSSEHFADRQGVL